jgi:hypothetical protein
MGRFPRSLYDVTFSNLFARVEAVGFACFRRFSYLALEPEELARYEQTTHSTKELPANNRTLRFWSLLMIPLQKLKEFFTSCLPESAL